VVETEERDRPERVPMSTIAISLCGEGRGHATRIGTLIEALEHDHRLLVYTSDDAYRFLAQRFSVGHPRVTIQEIPGIVFQYTGGRLDVMRSIRAGFEFRARQLGPLVDRLMRDCEAHDVSLAITDFEPALPRAASRQGIPLVSVDHQHFLLAYDLDVLPWNLQWNAWFMSHAVWMYVMEAVDTVVSAFFRPPLRSGWEHVVQVGPLLRRDVAVATPSSGGYLLSYLRRHTPFAAVESLAAAGMPVKVYGLGARDPVGLVSFQAIDERQFVKDLAGCTAVIAAAGNQLIGEAIHLGKPLLVLPERAHGEQSMNAWFLRGMGCGDFVPLEEVTPRHVRDFLADLDRFSTPLASRTGRMDGTPRVLDVIRGRLTAAISDAA
jgi:uncharacterized protein (TIGR00661 family)